MIESRFIEKLLNGREVEWFALEDIFDLKNGYTPSKSNKDYWENGTIPWFRMEDIRENGQILSSALQKVSVHAIKGGKLFPANSIIIATSATIGEHALITVPYLANQRFTNISLKKNFTNRVDSKFIFYYCFLLSDWCKKNTTISNFAAVDMVGFRKFPFPIPPIDVQLEIVRILDAFTSLTAELTSRQKQYQYFRDKLLNFDDISDKGGGYETNSITKALLHNKEVVFKALGEVVKIKNGKDWKQLEKGSIPVYGSGGIMASVDAFSYDKPTVLIPRKGSITNIFYVETPFWNVDTIYYTEININELIPKYFYHYMKTIDLEKLDTGSGRPSLTQEILYKIKIPVPSLEEQQRIVAILDKFETLTNSIAEGLPKEIELRRKQYEYYREQLLTFPK
ncbi:restriction endonuclease subunit S [Glaesserella parasuis]|uniref:restriction endonuclease subunit S n=1 Tax=Glaesserella parasuis TaxID=738 RepID=UPI002436AC71|nr:restriction endonuclease subunit S [Glaesserella parasuis]MDG6829404.1 restriction endonuclease subunit S [Glaesserella parasuis]MDP0191447.1 restriction endonuclease subunit S [Glaesserella parasuis]